MVVEIKIDKIKYNRGETAVIIYTDADVPCKITMGEDHEDLGLLTSGQIFEVDIRGILTSLAAGDYVGIKLQTMVDFNDVDVLGIMFKYT